MAMTMNPQDAAAALSEVEQTQWRSARSLGYRIASSHMILWGGIWALGYGLMAALPTEAWWKIWLPADVVGVAASMWIGLQRNRGGRNPAAARDTWRSLALSVFAGLFLGAVYFLFQPRTVEVYLVFPAVVLGGLYTCIGLFRMPRFLAIGIWIFAAATIGHLWLQPLLIAWLAGSVGGAMILGGLWLRRG